MPGTRTCFEEARAASLVGPGGTGISWKLESWQKVSMFLLPLEDLQPLRSELSLPLRVASKRSRHRDDPRPGDLAAVQAPELSPEASPLHPEEGRVVTGSCRGEANPSRGPLMVPCLSSGFQEATFRGRGGRQLTDPGSQADRSAASQRRVLCGSLSMFPCRHSPFWSGWTLIFSSVGTTLLSAFHGCG